MKHIPISVLLGLCGLLAGCAVPGSTKSYVGLAGNGYEFDNSGEALAPAMADRSEQGPLTLSEAVAFALANNPELMAGGYDMDAAGARYDAARGAMLPSIALAGGYAHHLDAQRLVPARFNGEPGLFSRDLLSGDVIVTMPLFTGGRLVSEMRAAELLEQSAGHRLSRSRGELIFNVSSVFYSVLAQRQVVASVQFSEQTMEEHLRRLKELLASAKAAPVDVLRTEVRLADIQQRLVREQNVQAILGRVLANLLGLGEQPPEGVTVVGELTLGDNTEPALDAVGGLTSAYSRRGDYLAARAAIEAQGLRLDAARATRWPTVAAHGAYGGRWALGTSDRRAGSSTAEDVGRVGLVMTVPLFDGGRIDARVRQEQATLAAARERFRKLELQIRLDVETAILNTTSARERVRAMSKAIEQAEETLRIEQQRYELGQGSNTDVLDAQAALLDSQMNHYRALADYRIALAQFELATGNGT